MRMNKVMMLGAVTATVLLGGASTALAESAGDFTGTGVRIWSQPTSASNVVGHGSTGDGVTYLEDRVIVGETYNCEHASTSNWGHIRNNRTGVVGYVPRCYSS